MTFMRVTRDQRGYETTFLLHTPRPGQRPKILYWYRTAPGVRVGRRPLDEDAIRTLEEQYPEIEFDWPQLIEEAESVPPEVDHPPERPRRRPKSKEADVRSEDVAEVSADEDTLAAAAPARTGSRAGDGQPGGIRPPDSATGEVSSRPEPNPLLDQLVGREIAARLRAKYAEIAVRLRSLPPDDKKDAWQQRAESLNPDRWSSAEAILEGMQHFERRSQELRRDLSLD